MQSRVVDGKLVVELHKPDIRKLDAASGVLRDMKVLSNLGVVNRANDWLGVLLSGIDRETGVFTEPQDDSDA